CFDLEIDWRSLDASDLVLSANGCFNPRPTHGSSHSLLPGWRSRTPPLRQRKRHQRIRIRVVVLVSSARGNHHVLLAGLAAKKGHGRGMGTGRQHRLPKLLTRVFIESPETRIVGCANEYQATGGDHRTTQI